MNREIHISKIELKQNKLNVELTEYRNVDSMIFCKEQEQIEISPKFENRTIQIDLKEILLEEGFWRMIIKCDSHNYYLYMPEELESLEDCYWSSETGCFIRLKQNDKQGTGILVYGKDSTIVKKDRQFLKGVKDRGFDVCIKDEGDTLGEECYLTVWKKDHSILIRQNLKDRHALCKIINEIISDYCYEGKERWLVYIEYLKEDYHVFKRLSTTELEKNHGDKYKDCSYRYFSRLKEFRKKENSYWVIPYFTENMKMSILVSQKEKVYTEIFHARLHNFKIKNRKLILKGTIPANDWSVTGAKLVYRHRREEDALEYFGDYRVRKNYYQLIFDLDEIEFRQFYWDIYIVMEKSGEIQEIKIMNTDKFFKRKFYKVFNVCQYISPDGHILYPYLTVRGDIALTYRKKETHDSISFRAKERFAFILSFLLKPYFKLNPVALVFEKFCVMAQDNAWYFFEYCMNHDADRILKKKIYYIMNPESDDYEKTMKYKNRILDFLSLKHMIYLFSTDLLVSTDTKFHSYAWKAQNSFMISRIKRKKIVFLQHGVIALKKVHKVYKKGGNNSVNLFVTSSDLEKNIILNYFGYKDHEIIVTGLPRWDVLEDSSSELKTREILLMPTWRNWLDDVENEEFMVSDYYKNYMNLLNSSKLQKMLEQYNIKLNFYIHPKFREYMHTFVVNNSKIRLIPFGSEQLNILMMRCSLLITDYSSVCWDVFYQGKPIVFYQFDLDEYNETQGSYIDMKKDLFGDRVTSIDELLDSIEDYILTDFKEKEKYQKKRRYLYKYVDKDNSKRICEEIRKRGW